MDREPFTYWQESDGTFLGYLNTYPDHWTQGDNFEDLKDHLLDLYQEFAKPCSGTAASTPSTTNR